MTQFLTHGPRRFWTVAVGALALSALVGSAQAAPCAPRTEMVKALSSNFNEKPLSLGLAGSGQLLVIFTSPAGTWTATTVSPVGEACIVAAGDGWTDLEPAAGAMAQTQEPR